MNAFENMNNLVVPFVFAKHTNLTDSEEIKFNLANKI
jgi:hypothetical protein